MRNGQKKLGKLGVQDVRRQEISLSETVMHTPELIGDATGLEQICQLMKRFSYRI
jgi:hypothetical protein